MTTPHRRQVQSFVRRAGRTTPAQARALAELWPRYGVERARGQLDLDALFGRRAARIAEIGFGNGEALAETAARQPATDFLGIEVHEPGIGRLLLALEKLGLTNVRVICGDAVEVLERWLPDACLSGVNLFFPDPWPKKRHHKRRLVQPGFLRLLAPVMAPGAVLHMATDWANYAEHMREVTGRCPWFDSLDSDGAQSARPETRFERRGRRLGHGVTDLRYRRNEQPVSAEIGG
jgi:tRNA (guanine-N7-)-methyltransferase